MNAVTLSIVVPCYNEEKNIPLILQRFHEIISGRKIEVILVNNGSTDESAAVISTLLPRYPFARVVSVCHNQGYGYGILCGLKEARGEFLGWTHADMQTDPSDVLRALTLIEQQGETKNIFLKGARQGRHFFDVFFTVGMSCFESLYLRTLLWDINAQPTLFHRSFYLNLKNPPHDFALDLFVYFHAKKSGLKIIRFPVKFPPRIHGCSSWNTSFGQKLKFIKRTFDFSRKLKTLLQKEGVSS